MGGAPDLDIDILWPRPPELGTCGVERVAREVNPSAAAPATYPGWFLGLVSVYWMAGELFPRGPGAPPTKLSIAVSPELVDALLSGVGVPPAAASAYLACCLAIPFALRVAFWAASCPDEPPKVRFSRTNSLTTSKTCPVGSEWFTGSPAQYIYAFNPPPPNGLQLSGL